MLQNGLCIREDKETRGRGDKGRIRGDRGWFINAEHSPMTERLDIRGATAHAAGAEANWPAVPGYEIIEGLGRGGMGVVYKARTADSNRPVALKMIRDGALAGAQEWGRFRIECEAAARMEHPNIVQIYEIGEYASRPYFAMQLVEGGSLAEW